MKNMKLFPKTFIHSLCLMVSVLLVAFFLIYSFLPTFYRQYKQDSLNADTKTLVEELENMSVEKISSAISSFAVSKGYGYIAVNSDDEMICSASTGMSFFLVGGDTSGEDGSVEMDIDIASAEGDFVAKDGEEIHLTLNVSLAPVDDAVSVLMYLLPAVLVFCIVLAAIISWIYAKAIVKPIKKITEATVEMQTLGNDVICTQYGNDEIGILSRNVNELYQTLLRTIHNLEQKIDEVSKSEQEKLDFLLLASHELKTPVTAVRGMIDGMLFNVGIYKDREKYLKECQIELENLTRLICSILETSKIDMVVAAKKTVNTDIGELLQKVTSDYEVLARNRNISMDLRLENNFYVVVSAQMIEKVISNTLSNAVKYTVADGHIQIYMLDRTVYIENECIPLSEEELSHIGQPFYRPIGRTIDNDSTGLGMYFTDRILSACALSYSFEPYENGMRFTLHF